MPDLTKFPIETEALVVQSPGSDLVMTKIAIQDLRPDEVLVEIKYSGLCHTDLLLLEGHIPSLPYPAIAGHEGAGVIVALGGDPDSSVASSLGLTVGTSVLCSYFSCGSCRNCKAKLTSKCDSIIWGNLGGVRQSDSSTAATLANGSTPTTPVSAHFFGQSSLSRLAVVNVRSIVKCEYPDQMGLYAPMGCGYQTGAGTVLITLKPEPQDLVVILGTGSVGMAAMMACAALGVKHVIMVDRAQIKLDLAREIFEAVEGSGGTITLINDGPRRSNGEFVDRVKKATKGLGAKFVIDTTGSGEVIEDMMDCVALGGTAVSVGFPPSGQMITIDAGAFFIGNKSWITVLEGDAYPPEFIPRMIDLHRQGKFPIEKLVKIYAVEDLKQARADEEAGKVITPVLNFSTTASSSQQSSKI